MADMEPSASEPHPATKRQAGYPSWTADPVIAALFAVLRDLNMVSAWLLAIHAERPDVGIDGIHTEIGEVAEIFERVPSEFFGYGYRVRGNGGICAGLWELLERRRTAWVDARLEVEGFAPGDWSVAKDIRTIALTADAISVEHAWEGFRIHERSVK